MNKLIRPFFYSNIFYGICTVALSIESNLLHGITLNSYRFYLLIFLSTIVYYGRIYYTSSVLATDERTKWYKVNRRYIRIALIILVCVIIADIFYMALLNRHILVRMPPYYWALLLSVPAFGIMYTSKSLPIKKLRRIGWLKPFIIGFVWAGVVTIFPVLFWQIRHVEEAPPGLPLKTLIFLENFLFISSLAIIFDIKDASVDKQYNLQTFPAKYGIAQTINYAVMPLALLSLITLLALGIYVGSLPIQIIIQSIPFIILLLLTSRFLNEKNLLFYLAAIDGLMLLKAICGIVSLSIF